MRKINVKSISVLMVPLLFLVFSIAPVALTYASGQGQMGVPGMPDDAILVDRTNITPVNQREQITANQMHVFAYRNVTMMMNCSHNSELDVTIKRHVQTRYLALAMEQNQAVLLHMEISTSPPPGITMQERTMNFYWGIEPNATIQLRAQLRLHINSTALNAELNREVDPSRLTWMYWKTGEGWIPVESSIDEDGYLVCETTHFSTWTVAEVMPLATPWMTYAIIAVVALVAITGGIMLVRRR